MIAHGDLGNDHRSHFVLWDRLVRALLDSPLPDLVSIDAHLGRGVNAQSNLAVVNLHHGNNYVCADAHLLSYLAAQD
jgi:hypothetical protein